MADKLTRVCVKCEMEYKVKKMGISVIEMASFGAYKIWGADLFECPKCHNQIVAGFSEKAAEHFEKGFQEYLEQVTENGNFILLKEHIFYD